MTATVRPINRQFEPVAQLVKPNLLISGCSFTFNNSFDHACSWPYYLRDLANATQVYDCSQVGAGNTHIFNSIINEIETNNAINPATTTVIVMLSGLTRTDVMATQEITRTWHDMSNYHFDSKFATLSIFNNVDHKSNTMLTDMCNLYKRLVDVDAQVYESCIKVLALKSYLRDRGFSHVITSWKNPQPELQSTTLASKMIATLDPVKYLGDYARELAMCVPDGHPTPDGYLKWTKDHLVPYLISAKLATDLNTI